MASAAATVLVHDMAQPEKMPGTEAGVGRGMTRRMQASAASAAIERYMVAEVIQAVLESSTFYRL